MAVMVTLTLKLDAATYQAAHGDLLKAAKAAGLIFHSGREVDGGIGVVDFWPSAEAFQEFFNGAAAERFQTAGVEPPDDVEFTPVLNADG